MIGFDREASGEISLRPTSTSAPTLSEKSPSLYVKKGPGKERANAGQLENVQSSADVSATRAYSGKRRGQTRLAAEARSQYGIGRPEPGESDTNASNLIGIGRKDFIKKLWIAKSEYTSRHAGVGRTADAGLAQRKREWRRLSTKRFC